MKQVFTKERRQKIRTFYNSRIWRKLRKRQILTQNLCQICWSSKPRRLTSAVDVDHIKPWKTYKEFIDPKNLQSLCRKCHLHKTFFYDVPQMVKEQKTFLNLKDI